MTEVILDVREKDEFEAEHIPDSIHLPLSLFATMAPGVLNQLREKRVVIMCRSGNRARMALEQMGRIGFEARIDAQVYEGGILAWKNQGRPVQGSKGRHLPILRQVQLIAGLLVVSGTLLGAFVNPAFLLLSGFVGAGLTVAGSTGFCGMALLLAKMPWNRTVPSTAKELCQVSPNSSGCES